MTDYELWMDAGTSNSDFTNVHSTSGNSLSLTHTVTLADDNLVLGNHYSFKFRSKNDVGYSEFSSIKRIGFGAAPEAVSTLASDLDNCGPTYVAMSWSTPTGTHNLPILGYIVQMINPISDEWETILDASTDPDKLSHTEFGLVNLATYTFRVYAVNFNGMSTNEGN
mmetsp:Transcript_23477/g.36170  ORF Transcript_23477/g.36170 Transcript_23477/m.36170 type:complete len:167 (+) Transcript_23477:497-997(+)